jgi:hypothetical protein
MGQQCINVGGVYVKKYLYPFVTYLLILPRTLFHIIFEHIDQEREIKISIFLGKGGEVREKAHVIFE